MVAVVLRDSLAVFVLVTLTSFAPLPPGDDVDASGGVVTLWATDDVRAAFSFDSISSRAARCAEASDSRDSISTSASPWRTLSASSWPVVSLRWVSSVSHCCFALCSSSIFRSAMIAW